ncbi:MAG TPA: twin-arginine translocase TatA/TatE family subunit [Coriobacteriia bacterium]
MKLFEPQVLIIILIIVLIIFGPKQLPQLGKSLGKTMKSIRDGAEGKDEDEELPEAKAAATANKAEADKEPAAKGTEE